MLNTKKHIDTDYLQLAAEITQPVKEASYDRMRLKPGQKVLDVGCGPGTDTITLAHKVGPGGMVVGIDFDADMVQKATERAQALGLSYQVAHRVANALHLPFETGEFDASRSERMFQHLLQPEKALDEMARITKQGGPVVVLDSDWATFSLDSKFTDLERRLARVRVEHCLTNGCSGRQLYRLFKQQGLVDITIDTFSLSMTQLNVARLISASEQVESIAIHLGIATDEECACWRADLQEADVKGVFFASLSMVLVAGCKAT